MNAKSDSNVVSLDDEEVICEWMEPDGLSKPFDGPEEAHPYRWWKWYMRFPAGLQSGQRRHINIDLTLDRLHQVEERLTDGQWLQYSVCCWKWYTEAATGNDYEISHLNRWRKVLIHLTAEQKIKALAATIRATKPHATKDDGD